MPIALTLSYDIRFLIFPALLLTYFLVLWVKVGRDPKLEAVAPLYGPPPGVSPALARYILTGGTDGTSLAAILVQLSARRVVSIEPGNGTFHVELLQKDSPMQPEEAAAVATLFRISVPGARIPAGMPADTGALAEEIREVIKKIPSQQLASKGLALADELSAEQRRAVDINPRHLAGIDHVLRAVEDVLQKRYQGVYFKWHFRYVGLAMLATLFYGMGTAAFLRGGNALFLTFWIFLFTGGAGTVIAMSRGARPARPSPGQRLQDIIFPLAFFAVPIIVVGALALPEYFLFVVGMVLASIINSIFLVLMRAPTEAGRQVIQHLAGFKEFLTRVEQDRMERLNSPEEKARVMNEFMAYAVALGVREGWGDRMASAFSNAAVQR
jgi:hypothetical protein